MSDATKQILVADDEPNLRRVLSAQLHRDGYEVIAVEDGQAALEALEAHHVDVIITDLRMPRVDGMELLKKVTHTYPDVPVIMITAHGTVDTAVEALKLGAFDYITKPFEQSELRNVVAKASRTRELSQRDVAAEPSEPGRYRLIGQSPPMADVYQVIEKVADTPSTVLITGESGTGKELIARALHENSSRKKKPFIRVNCAAIPRDLIESELFGYEKGAFTGAVTSKPGRFELAHDGTLFLDEIGEIPVNMQVKLLRAIQEQEFERVGGIKTIEVDVRLVAATNRDLQEEIEAGSLPRGSLLPPQRGAAPPAASARAHRATSRCLVDHFIRRFRDKLKKDVRGVTDAAMERLLAHPWPGNIRELENVIERCLLFCDGERIDVGELPPEMRLASASIPTTDAAPAGAEAKHPSERPDAGSQGSRPRGDQPRRARAHRARAPADRGQRHPHRAPAEDLAQEPADQDEGARPARGGVSRSSKPRGGRSVARRGRRRPADEMVGDWRAMGADDPWRRGGERALPRWKRVGARATDARVARRRLRARSVHP